MSLLFSWIKILPSFLLIPVNTSSIPRKVVFPPSVMSSSLLTWTNARCFLSGEVSTGHRSEASSVCVTRCDAYNGSILQSTYMKMPSATTSNIDLHPSPDGTKLIAYYPNSGDTDVFSSRGKRLQHSTQQYGGGRRIQWYADSRHWLEDSIFTPRWGETHFAMLGGINSKRLTYLMDTQTHRSVLTPQTFTLKGSGDSLWLLDVDSGRVSIESMLEGLPVTAVTLRQMKVAPNTTFQHIVGVSHKTQVPAQSTSLVFKQTIPLPKLLCLQDAVFSPNAQQVLLLCYPPLPKEGQNQKPARMDLYVYQQSRHNLRLVTSFEATHSSFDVGRVGWCNSNEDIWFKDGDEIYTVHLQKER